MLLPAIRDRLRLLAQPRKGIQKELEKSFEKSLYEYLALLILLAVVSGIVIFIVEVAKAAYYDLVYSAQVRYFNMLNYTMGKANGTLFFYFFAGTFIVFVISMLLKSFYRFRYTQLLQLLFASLSPLLLFGWLPQLAAALTIWSAFLFFSNAGLVRRTRDRRNSLKHRG